MTRERGRGSRPPPVRSPQPSGTRTGSGTANAPGPAVPPPRASLRPHRTNTRRGERRRRAVRRCRRRPPRSRCDRPRRDPASRHARVGPSGSADVTRTRAAADRNPRSRRLLRPAPRARERPVGRRIRRIRRSSSRRAPLFPLPIASMQARTYGKTRANAAGCISAGGARRTWTRPRLRTVGRRYARPYWPAVSSPSSRWHRTGPGPPGGRSIRRPTAAACAPER